MGSIPNWKKTSGSFRIDEITTPDPVLKTIKKGTKVLTCVTAGTIAIPSKQAYGTWEFDWYKATDTTELNIGILQPNPLTPISKNGYYVKLSNFESIKLYKNIIDFFATTTAYFSNSTWYRVRITRTLSGSFAMLIKGGAFTGTAGYDGWTLVSTSGGSGTNPVTDNTYTTSEYFVLDIDAGDRIANINLYDGIKQY